MESLWESMVPEKAWEEDERLPYWAELWPSSLALANWLFANRDSIAGKSCMDLGCGLGFTALCGASLGAFVIGADYEADAIALAKENAAANNFKVIDFCYDTENGLGFQKNISCGQAGEQACEDEKYIDFRVMDWRAPSIAKHSLDFIWAADIVYERAFAKPILEFLDYALKDTGKVWIAEPGRTIFEHFPEMLKDTTLKMQRVRSEETKGLSDNIPKANVNIWEIVRSKML